MSSVYLLLIFYVTSLNCQSTINLNGQNFGAINENQIKQHNDQLLKQITKNNLQHQQQLTNYNLNGGSQADLNRITDQFTKQTQQLSNRGFSGKNSFPSVQTFPPQLNGNQFGFDPFAQIFPSKYQAPQQITQNYPSYQSQPAQYRPQQRNQPKPQNYPQRQNRIDNGRSYQPVSSNSISKPDRGSNNNVIGNTAYNTYGNRGGVVNNQPK
jgi:hypothetical protein